MTFAREAHMSLRFFLGLYHSRPKGAAYFSFLVTGACLPRLLMGTFGLALTTQRAR